MLQSDPTSSEPADLPVRLHGEEILEAVRNNSVVVILAETGSGKTTQVAQLLLDGGLLGENGRVAVTQPRRVAAVTVARRVAWERGCALGDSVGYTVRFEDVSSSSTRLLYLTDGCLLREMLSDPQLLRYDIVVLDEAHERSLATDILFALLKRLSGERVPKLRLVVTSATLDSDKFAAYFGNCPVLRVPGRVFPVTVAHALEPPPPGALLSAALDTVWEVHCAQPAGDVLLFCTGADECERAVRELLARTAAAPPELCGDLQVLPLYAALSPEQQARIFKAAPAGVRRVVAATNIAETSLTVPGVVYVVDPGTVKQKEFDPRSGLEQLLVRPISRVAAQQRTGRAGRTCPGRCYRRYTESALAATMPAETAPEVQRCSLAAAVLHLKSLALPRLDVLAFDFLDPPAAGALADALLQLWLLGCLGDDGSLSPLGRACSRLPLDPPLARAALAAAAAGVLPDCAAVAGMLSAERVFEPAAAGSAPPCTQLLSRAEAALGDHVLLLRTFQAWEEAGCSPSWARAQRVQQRALELARSVRGQLLALFPPAVGGGSLDALREALCAGYAGRLAHRVRGHNGYRTLAAGGAGLLAVLHPGCSPALADADGGGLGPDWLIYHELVSAGRRPMLRNVCAVESAWALPLAEKLQRANVCRLSGGRAALPPQDDSSGSALASAPSKPTAPAGPLAPPKAEGAAVEAARQRYLKRKTLAAA